MDSSVTPFVMHHGQRWIIYGRSGTGKTWILIQVLGLLARLHPNPIIILVSPNAEGDKTWKKLHRQWTKVAGRPLVNKHFTSYTPDVQKYLNTLIRRRRSRRKGPPIVVVLDDQGENHIINRTFVDNPIRDISVSARHLQMTLIMSYQRIKHVLGILAINAELIITKKLETDEYEEFRKLYLGTHTKEEFEALCATVFVDQFDTLIVDRSNPPDVVLWRNFNERIQIKQET